MSRIMVVEDDEALQKCFKRKLMDHEVIICSDSQSAIKILNKNDIDVIFLDYNLKNGDTTEPVAEYLSYILKSELKIFIHTGNPIAAKLLESIIKKPCIIVEKNKLIPSLEKYI